MKLIDVYPDQTEVVLHILYTLLGERDKDQSISHKKMPTWDEHVEFVYSHPYLCWYLIDIGGGKFVGAIYLTNNREIGIGIFKGAQRKGYATTAINLLMELYPGSFLANINEKNKASIKLFKKLGFNKIQVTLAKF